MADGRHFENGFIAWPVWRTAALLKIVFGYISMSYCLIDAVFGMYK